MKNPVRLGLASAITVLTLSSAALAQRPEVQPAPFKRSANPAPAAKHDLNGVWAGPLTPALYDVPAMTPWGEAQYQRNRSNGAYAVATANDPLTKCDPLGFPRDVLYQTRGIEFAASPTKMFELFQYQKAWREIWTDGRSLPKNVGGNTIDAPDARYYGYSVGHWEGDYTFVIDSNGTDESTWLDNRGHPHSGELTAEERYTRVDHDDLHMEVSINDPKAYTKPWLASKADLVWIPSQEFEEQLCIPSNAATYFSIIAGPAGAQKK